MESSKEQDKITRIFCEDEESKLSENRGGETESWHDERKTTKKMEKSRAKGMEAVTTQGTENVNS